MLYDDYLTLEAFITEVIQRESPDGAGGTPFDSEAFLKRADECLKHIKSTEAKVIGIDVEKMIISNLKTIQATTDCRKIDWGIPGVTLETLMYALECASWITNNTLDLILNPPNKREQVMTDKVHKLEFLVDEEDLHRFQEVMTKWNFKDENEFFSFCVSILYVTEDNIVGVLNQGVLKSVTAAPHRIKSKE